MMWLTIIMCYKVDSFLLLKRESVVSNKRRNLLGALFANMMTCVGNVNVSAEKNCNVMIRFEIVKEWNASGFD